MVIEAKRIITYEGCGPDFVTDNFESLDDVSNFVAEVPNHPYTLEIPWDEAEISAVFTNVSEAFRENEGMLNLNIFGSRKQMHSKADGKYWFVVGAQAQCPYIALPIGPEDDPVYDRGLVFLHIMQPGQHYLTVNLNRGEYNPDQVKELLTRASNHIMKTLMEIIDS